MDDTEKRIKKGGGGEIFNKHYMFVVFKFHAYKRSAGRKPRVETYQIKYYATRTHLCSDNSTFLVLLSLLHDKLGTLSFLCCHLFSFNRMSKLLPKAQGSNGHIIQSNVEVPSPVSEYLPDFPTYSLHNHKRSFKSTSINCSPFLFSNE